MFTNQQINILTKAFPYMPSTSKPILDVIIKANQLKDCIDNASHQDIKACDIQNEPPVNIECLLRELKPVCSKKDAGYIDTILSLLRTKNILNTYKGMNSDFMANADSFTNDLFKNTQFESQGGIKNEQ